MKSFKCLLALPLMITSLTACGGNDQFAKSDYDKVVAIAENYAKSVTNSKAAGIAVSGRINKINIKGDATWWSYELPEDAGGSGLDQSLISMIPNFSLKNGEISIDPQNIATFSLPASLVSVAETYLQLMNDKKTDKVEVNVNEAAKQKKISAIILLVLANLPKFPMNTNLLKFVNGIKELKYNEETNEVDWDNLEYKAWEHGKVSYFTNAGRIKVTVSTDDIETFIWEISKLFDEEGDIPQPQPQPKKTYPASFSVTTSKIGYIDSLSVNLKAEGEKFEQYFSSYAYLYLNGDIDIDLSLNFKQTISDPITIKYQVTAYKEATASDSKVDAVYGAKGRERRLIREKIVGPTTNLDELKDYVTFDWYSNTESGKDPNAKILTKIYDDPIFCRNYWKNNEKNIAFLNQAYDVVVLPSFSAPDPTKPKELMANYKVLGAEYRNQTTSLNSISVDGRIVSDKNGLPSRSTEKMLISAADGLVSKVTFSDDSKDTTRVNAHFDEVFINSNILQSRKAECIINISVCIFDYDK